MEELTVFHTRSEKRAPRQAHVRRQEPEGQRRNERHHLLNEKVDWTTKEI